MGLMQIITDQISLDELKKMAKNKFGNFVKAVIDLEKKVMVVNSDLHSDEEALLLEQGSKQQNLWGINLYPGERGGNFIEYDSMINLRPSQNNLSRNVDDEKIREKIKVIIDKLTKK